MSEPVIKVSGLGKQYHIGGVKKSGRTLVETLTDAVRSPFRRGEEDPTTSFWALKDVNFEIKQGEVVGIIGRNGAGKSTLLKILSRITDPTEGEIDITGRVGSLLEVGTGFHPELTGRENVYLNGAILGMKKADIAKKFDEIVAFAETEKFLDTPVKFYSSGMYTRLAFAVAAHLEPDILIVDEVLAVGDAQFQKKCMGKMQDVAGEGRTVIFVSHNLGSLRLLCKTGVFLASGKVVATGTIGETLAAYARQSESGRVQLDDIGGRNVVKVEEVKIRVNGIDVDAVSTGEDVTVSIALKFLRPVPGEMSIGIAVESVQTGFLIINYSSFQGVRFRPESGTFTSTLKRLPIVSGKYQLHIRILVGSEEVFWNTNAAALVVHLGDFYRTGLRGEENLCPWNYELGWTSDQEPTDAK